MLWGPDILIEGLCALTEKALQQGRHVLPPDIAEWLMQLGRLFKPGPLYRDEVDWLRMIGRLAVCALSVAAAGVVSVNDRELVCIVPLVEEHWAAIKRMIGLMTRLRGLV